MSPETLTALVVAVGEIFAAIREALTSRRKDQAGVALPEAELLDAHIRQLIAEALERAKNRPPAPAAPAGAPHPLAAGADALKEHIDALVDQALGRVRVGLASATLPSESASTDPTHPTAGAAPPGPAVGRVVAAAEQTEKSGPGGP